MLSLLKIIVRKPVFKTVYHILANSSVILQPYVAFRFI